MPLVKISAVLLAICLCGAWAFAFPAVAADKPGQGAPIEQGPQTSAKIVEPESVGGGWQQALLRTARQAGEVIAAGYKRAPVLVTILSALLVLPAVALASVTVQTAARLSGERRSRKAAMSASGAGAKVPARPSQAWLSIDGEAEGTHPVAGEMIRIGRHPDNEVWLTDTSVHRYHAVIHRTEDADFFITDLSGEEGNGVRINGTRRAQSPLSDGDVIELGKARITFASAPI